MLGEESKGRTGKKISNTRLIKWSDGSMSLQVGSEIFDVSSKSLTMQHQYLFVRHAVGNVLQAEAKFEAALGFRPVNTSSLTHKKLTATVLAKHQKVNRTKFIGTVVNPEKAKIEMEKVLLYICLR
jgi:RNA polymerase-associated protein LEO1